MQAICLMYIAKAFSTGIACYIWSIYNTLIYTCFSQLNISFPATGCQKLIEVDDERKLRTFYEKRMATEVAADPLGDEWKVSCGP